MGASDFQWLIFDKEGNLKDPAAVVRLQDALAKPGIEELLVISHGWNNDRPVAEKLYETLWKNVDTALKKLGRNPQAVVIAAILWPAKEYDGTYDGAEDFANAKVTGAALGLDGGGAPEVADVPDAHLERVLDQLKNFLEIEDISGIASAARKAADPNDDQAARELFTLTKSALGYDSLEQDPELKNDMTPFRKADTNDGAHDLLLAFGAPRTIPLAPGVGSAQGLGDAVKGAFSGIRSGVVWALNKVTYYTMKKRAGVIGRSLATVLGRLKLERDVRLHLVGHSFGGRLVTATADSLTAIAHLEFRSLTLLQAAFSHNGLTQGMGPFAGVIGKPTGPICFTHTHNDKACTIAYPIASRLSGDATKGLGDKDDRFGAMGANGPQLVGAMMAPDCVTTNFAPVPGKINRFLADTYVVKTASTDAHNNITNEQCGRLVAAAMTA